jgi:predicted transcriptional regulator
MPTIEATYQWVAARVSPELVARVREQATREDLNKSQVIRRALSEWCERREAEA